METKAIILAAGRGSRMKHLTRDHPKGLVTLFGQSLIRYQLDALQKAGVSDITIVTGYAAEDFQPFCTQTIHNADWATTNMVSSLLCAEHILKAGPTIISYSDIFYMPAHVASLLQSDYEASLTYDPDWEALWRARFDDPLEDAETFKINTEQHIGEIGRKARSVVEIQGQYMGLLKFTPQFWAKARQFFGTLSADAIGTLNMTGFLQSMIEQKASIHGVPIAGLWGEIDSADDLDFYEQDTRYRQQYADQSG